MFPFAQRLRDWWQSFQILFNLLFNQIVFAGNFFRDNPLAIDRKNPVKVKKPPKDPILEKLKIWAELLGVKEHQNFMATMAKERDVKNKIKDLNRFDSFSWNITTTRYSKCLKTECPKSEFVQNLDE